MDEKFSLRWGIPYDQGFTVIPNIILKNYARLGITTNEMMLVIHLASYKHEAQNSEAYPSLRALAYETGKSIRQIQRILRSLESKGMLRIVHQNGSVSIYDFTPLAQKCHELAQEEPCQKCHPLTKMSGGDDKNVRGGGDMDVRGGTTFLSPEEKTIKRENKKDNNNSGVVVPSQPSKEKELQELAYQALRSKGITEKTARCLVQKHPPHRIFTICTAAERQPGVRDKAAWTIKALEGDWSVALRASHPYENEEYRRMEALLRQGAYKIRNPLTGEYIDVPKRNNGQGRT